VTEAELIEVCKEFRDGVLEFEESSESMCAVVSWALQGYLSAACGIDTECVTTDLTRHPDSKYVNHVWLQMPDGRALDATFDQFGGDPVYLGEPTEFHIKEG